MDVLLIDNPRLSKIDKRQIIQKVILPKKGYPKNLYLKFGADKHSEDIISPVFEDGKIQLTTGNYVSTNTYFNSFYDAYWKRYTIVDDLYFECEFSGNIILKIIKVSQGQHLPIEYSVNLNHENKKSVLFQLRKLEIELFGTTFGRYYIDVTARNDSTIHSMSFLTTQKPKRNIDLSIGLCTFNREDEIIRTLSEIQNESDGLKAIKKVIIVNQGNEIAPEKIKNILKDDRFDLIEQENYGGCGGFTRTIIEAQKIIPPATYHLLMDDDIILDTRVISRSIVFLNYAKEEIVLGGSMFDILKPNILIEGGAFIHPDNHLVPYAHNVDMSNDAGLAHFEAVVETDFNAWWYCMIPLTKLEDINYPAPIFIRGDDFEYGQRLAQQGTPTISLPGVAVWHEPFYAKATGWQLYYDLRNRLIFGATYPTKVNDLSIILIIDLFFNYLLQHKYGELALIHKAVNDYLDGPDELFLAYPDQKHQHINEIYGKYQVGKLTEKEAKFMKKGKKKNRILSTVPSALHFIYRSVAMLTLPLKKNINRIFSVGDVNSNSVGNEAYVVTNNERTYFHAYTPDRKNFAQGLLQSLKLSLKYMSQKNKAKQDWLENIDTYRQYSVWEKIFNRVDDK